jgi:DNA-cytosine methyltransferase
MNPQSDKLKVLDLFSGIGMFSYGLEKTNLYKTVAFCENDTKCQQVLKKHWPSVYCYSDISKLEWYGDYLYSEECETAGFTDVDIVCGGFPCQDLSIANRNGDGLKGSRSGLWSEYKRLIFGIKPKGVIIENVSALLNKGFATILCDLDSLGYDAEWHCITAKYFGAYHERDRVFILAYNRSIRGSGFKPLQCVEKIGQGWEGCQETLQQIYDNPFRRSGSVPEPLLRRMDVGNTVDLDRLKQIGNTVYWPIVKQLGDHLYENINSFGKV